MSQFVFESSPGFTDDDDDDDDDVVVVVVVAKSKGFGGVHVCNGNVD